MMKRYVFAGILVVIMTMSTFACSQAPNDPLSIDPTPITTPEPTPTPTPEPTPTPTYTIIVYLNHDEDCDEYFVVEVGENITIAEISIDERNGFDFNGWSLSPDRVNESAAIRVAVDFVITEDMVIYANWRRDHELAWLDAIPINSIDASTNEMFAFSQGLHKDITIEDFESFFGIEASGVGSANRAYGTYRFANENGVEVRVTFLDGINSVQIYTEGMIRGDDFSDFYNPNIIFDFDKLNDISSVDREEQFNAHNFNRRIFDIKYNDIVKMAGGVEGIQISWAFQHDHTIGSFYWFDGEYGIFAGIRPDGFVSMIFFERWVD
jgi:hypothetical protein